MVPFFFFNDTATTEIYTLSLHDALPIFHPMSGVLILPLAAHMLLFRRRQLLRHGLILFGVLIFGDRKSTRLNSSHSQISYAVFCLKKKKDQHTNYLFVNPGSHDILLLYV